MLQTIQTLAARALVRLAIIAAPAELAEKLRDAMQPVTPTGGGGPRPTVPK